MSNLSTKPSLITNQKPQTKTLDSLSQDSVLFESIALRLQTPVNDYKTIHPQHNHTDSPQKPTPPYSPYFCMLFPQLTGCQSLPKTLLELSETDYLKLTHLHNIPFPPRSPVLAPPETQIAKKDYLEKVRQDINALDDVPNSIKDVDFWMQALETNVDAIFNKIPKDLLNKEIVLKALELKHFSALVESPKRLKDDAELCFASALKSSQGIDSIPKEYLDKIFITLILLNDPIILHKLSKDITCNPDILTDELIDKIIKKYPFLIRYIPEERGWLELYQFVINKGYSIRYIPHQSRTMDLTLTSLKNDPESFEYIPTAIINEDLCLEALKSGLSKADLIKILNKKGFTLHSSKTDKNEELFTLEKKKMTESDYIDFLQLERIPIEDIPVCERTLAIYLHIVIKVPSYLEKIPDIIKSREFYNELFSRKCIKWLDIPEHIRKTLNYNTDLFPLLCTDDDPLRKDVCIYHHENELIKELSKRSLSFESDIYDALYKLKYSDDMIHPLLFPTASIEVEKELKNGGLFGGRTIKQNTHYFKFWRTTESLKNFVCESKAVAYLAHHKDSLNLKSEIPTPIEICKLLITPESRLIIECFKDSPQTISDPITGNTYYLIYHYTASEGYSIFAHQKDSDPANPYQKSHTGVLKGIYDMARLAKLGILYTNVLPAFHASGYNSWLALAQIFTNQDIEYPGSIMSWCENATEYPDYGYSGLRDFGDYDLLGMTTTYLERTDQKTDHVEWLLAQKASLHSTLHENMVAAVLLYARLHRTDPNYHHSNQESIKRTQSHLDNLLKQMLEGYLGKLHAPHELMDISEIDYQEWLSVSSQRLIYWTEVQANNPSSYANDLLKNNQLNPKIYPKHPYHGDLDSSLKLEHGYAHPTSIYTDSSGNFHEEGYTPALGPPHTISVLINFLEGLSLISRRLEQQVMPLLPT